MIEKHNLDDKINELIKEHNLPKDTFAIGFVVYQPEADKFLAEPETFGLKNETWERSPITARKLSQRKAIKEAKKHKKDSCVMLLLDTGTHYINCPSLTPDELVHYDENGRRKKLYAIK